MGHFLHSFINPVKLRKNYKTIIQGTFNCVLHSFFNVAYSSFNVHDIDRFYKLIGILFVGLSKFWQEQTAMGNWHYQVTNVLN